MNSYRLMVSVTIPHDATQKNLSVKVTWRHPGTGRLRTKLVRPKPEADYPLEDAIAQVFSLGSWMTRGGAISEQPITTYADGSELQRVASDNLGSGATYALELAPLPADLRAQL